MQDLRQQIVDASVELIAREGVRALSFREVARQAKVSHQAPYHYFEDHRAILREIARQGFISLSESMRSAAGANAGDSLAALCASGEAYIRFARKNVGHFRVMFQKSLLRGEGSKTALKEGEQAYGVLLDLSQRALKEGHGRGLSLDALALLCWTTVHGVASLLADGGIQGVTPEEAQREVIQSLRQLLVFPAEDRSTRRRRRS